MTDLASSPLSTEQASTTYRKKLIEVALPLEAINRESAREKSIRHGHPSTLHLTFMTALHFPRPTLLGTAPAPFARRPSWLPTARR